MCFILKKENKYDEGKWFLFGFEIRLCKFKCYVKVFNWYYW